MILYYNPQTRAFPVLWTLEEFGVEYELKIIDLKRGDQKMGEYRRINPMMKVPTLTDGEVMVTETGAILQYIAEKNPSPCLIPQLGDAMRPTCLRWLFFVGSNLEPAMGEQFNGWTPNPYYNGWGDFNRVRNVIAETLNAGPRLLGERVSATDIYLASDLRIARAGELIAADLEPFASYLARIASRAAFLRAMKIDSDLAS